jgi:3-hydroxybutyryl-CoA dehydrogenase
MNNRLSSIGIIGEGKMGTNIFHYLLGFPFPLTWLCSDDADLDKLRKSFQKKLKRSLDAGIMDEQRIVFRTENTRITNKVADLSSCNLIIEAIPEHLSLKQELFRKLDSIADPACIFASNSSSIKPSELFPSGSRSDKMIGLHFFYPVALKNIVELIITPSTSKQTIDRAELFLEGISRVYLLQDERSSFILNRIFLSFQNTAYLMVIRGKATIRQMDLIRENFFPFGAFDFMDNVGIATMLNAVLNYTRDYPDKCSYQPLINRLRGMSENDRFNSDDEESDDPWNLAKEEIVSGLRNSLRQSFINFSSTSGIAEDKLISALDEYFGVDFAKLIH